MIEALLFIAPALLGQIALKYGPEWLKDLINKICEE